MKNKLFASIPAIIFGLLIVVAPLTFAKPCSTGGMQKMHMMMEDNTCGQIQWTACAAS